MRGGGRRRAPFALWAAGAPLLSACEHWCAAEYSCSGESCGDCPGCTPPANATVEAVNTTLAACPIEPPADRAAARVGCILVAALAGFVVVVALVWRPSRKGCSGERVSRWATLLSSSLLVCGSSLLIVFLSSLCGDPNFFYAGISCCAAGLAIATTPLCFRWVCRGGHTDDTPRPSAADPEPRRPSRLRLTPPVLDSRGVVIDARGVTTDAEGAIIDDPEGLRRSASDGALAALGRSFVGLVRSPSQKSFTKGAEASSSSDDV